MFAPRVSSPHDRRLVADELESFLLETYAPRQLRLFRDDAHGGFHEALDEGGRPSSYAQKRLLVTCRQLYVASHATIATRDSGRLHLSSEFAEVAHHGFQFLSDRYRDPRHDGWYFSVTRTGQPLDTKKDLYAHAFVLFAASYYYRATGERDALGVADRTLELLDERLRDHDDIGYFEEADHDWDPTRSAPLPRRQNPHMHLLEACLAAARFTEQDHYRSAAAELRDWFEQKWLDPTTGTLREFFGADWSPHPTRGEIVEPGHHFEWNWILHEHAALTGDSEAQRLGDALANWAERRGHDDDGLVFDELDTAGRVISGSKRIWPQLEAIKSAAAQVIREAATEPGRVVRLGECLDRVFDAFVLPSGSWIEQRDRERRVLRPELPGSTGYHIFFALSEAIRALRCD